MEDAGGHALLIYGGTALIGSVSGIVAAIRVSKVWYVAVVLNIVSFLLELAAS
jgi:hypothetical protein